MSVSDHLRTVAALVLEAPTLGFITALNIADFSIGTAAIVGGWLLLRRGRTAAALPLFLATAVLPLVIAANTCDVERVCRDTAWLRLPSPLANWQVSLRTSPVQPAASDARLIVHRLTTKLTVYPAGAALPRSFIEQAKTSGLGGHSSCFDPYEQRCSAFALDIYGDGKPAVILASPNEAGEHYLAAEIFRAGPDAKWFKSGELVVTCATSIDALRKGQFSFAMPKARDIVLAGRPFNLLSDPDFGCPELNGERARAPWNAPDASTP